MGGIECGGVRRVKVGLEWFGGVELDVGDEKIELKAWVVGMV